MRVATGVVLVVTATLWARVSSAQNTLSFSGLFERRCAACHDARGGDQQAPNRQALSQMSPDRVYTALTTGARVPNATGLTEQDKQTLVVGLTGRMIGAGSVVGASAMKNRCAPGTRMGRIDTGPAWNGWSPDAENGRFQRAEAAGLTVDQVPHLKLKWAFGLPGGASAWGPATVAGGWLFVGCDNGAVYALDPRTGCVHWSAEAKTGVRTISTWPASGMEGVRFVAYFGDIWANCYAVDAETGRQIWTVRADDHKLARILASLALDAESDRVHVPVTSLEGPAGANLSYANLSYECCTFRGSVVALDASTGRQIWKRYTIPDPARPIRTSSKGTQLFGPAGGAVWNTPTLDRARGLLYFGSGNDYISPPSRYTDAIFAVCLATGESAWCASWLPAMPPMAGAV